ncbi:MAG: ADP-ribosylglycohydrolase family protein [Ottowia sp.]|nr:ADP-ribosylglycohydrolase family protein [Ottowia sp.]MBK6616594.1 ADP-ribosylglycohydrolase family protein [Ottowia sp.]
MFTDDSVVVAAVADALGSGTDVADAIRSWVKRYPARGYGSWFVSWCRTPGAGPTESHGNGSAMRMGPVALAARNEEDLGRLVREVVGITHSDAGALSASFALATAVFMGIKGESKGAIRDKVSSLGFYRRESVEELRALAEFSEMATRTVPVALVCALEASSFEGALRNAIAVGGDTDTIASMAGGLAEALYGVPAVVREQVEAKVPAEMMVALRVLYETSGREFPLPGDPANTCLPRSEQLDQLSTHWWSSLGRWARGRAGKSG